MTDMKIHFMGGADTVTGSQHILECGDSLVLRKLGAKARERQRYGLGIPLLLAGICALLVLAHFRRRHWR